MDDRLQKFARIIELGSFSRAAEELRISQPALSFAVAKLEKELGAILLIRGHRRFEITAAGKLAYDAAKEHQAINDAIRLRIRDIAGQRPHITIGMIDSIAETLCANTAALDRLEQSASVSIVVNNSRFLRDAIEHRGLNIAFVVADSQKRAGIVAANIGAEKLVLVCAPDQHQVSTQAVARGLLENFIGYDRPSRSFQIIDHALRSLGIQTNTTLQSSSPAVILEMILRGRGVAALPIHTVRSYVEAKQLITIQKDGVDILISRPLQIVRHKSQVPLSALEQFVDHTIRDLDHHMTEL